MRRLLVLAAPTWLAAPAARRRLLGAPAYVDVEVLGPESAETLARLPALDPPRREGELVVASDAGEVWREPRSWTVLLYALREARGRALALARRGDPGRVRLLARAMLQEGATRQRAPSLPHGLAVRAAVFGPLAVLVAMRLTGEERGAALAGLGLVALLPAGRLLYAAAAVAAVLVVWPSALLVLLVLTFGLACLLAIQLGLVWLCRMVGALVAPPSRGTAVR